MVRLVYQLTKVKNELKWCIKKRVVFIIKWGQN